MDEGILRAIRVIEKGWRVGGSCDGPNSDETKCTYKVGNFPNGLFVGNRIESHLKKPEFDHYLISRIQKGRTVARSKHRDPT